MKEKKQYVVFGLGAFGRSVALTLENMGCDVIAVDNSYERIQEISDAVSYAIRADVCEMEALESLGGRNLDGAVVAIGENLEASIMAIMAAKDMGIPYVLAKAKGELDAKVLKKIGADAVILPERESGERVAKTLMSATFTDWIELSDDFSLVEVEIPKAWTGQTLAEIRVRENYGVNIVGMIQNDSISVTVDPQEPLPEEGLLIMIGSNKNLEFLQNK